MEILFGTKARCAGGEIAGEVARVVIDNRTTETTHVVIGKGPLMATDWMVPLSMVEGMTSEGLQLYATCEQLPQLPQYIPNTILTREGGAKADEAEDREREAQPGSPESQAVTVRRVSVELGRECQVMATDGLLGPLAGVRLELYTNRLTSVIVSAGAQYDRAVDVPAPWISRLGAGSIKLATNKQAAAKLLGPEAGPYLAVEGEAERTEGGAM